MKLLVCLPLFSKSNVVFRYFFARIKSASFKVAISNPSTEIIFIKSSYIFEYLRIIFVVSTIISADMNGFNFAFISCSFVL